MKEWDQVKLFDINYYKVVLLCEFSGTDSWEDHASSFEITTMGFYFS